VTARASSAVVDGGSSARAIWPPALPCGKSSSDSRWTTERNAVAAASRLLISSASSASWTRLLRKTRLIDSFIGSDYVLLTELAMLGELREIPEILFQKRVYPGMSNVVHKTRSQWLAWLDSSVSGRGVVLPPTIHIGLQCAKSVNRLPLTKKEKAQCYFAVPMAWYIRQLRNLGGRYKQNARRVLGTSFLKRAV